MNLLHNISEEVVAKAGFNLCHSSSGTILQQATQNSNRPLAGITDPVSAKLVTASHLRPDGNITGLATLPRRALQAI